MKKSVPNKNNETEHPKTDEEDNELFNIGFNNCTQISESNSDSSDMDASPDEVESNNEEELSNKKSDCNTDEVEISHNEKGGSYLLAHQIQEKWEVKFSSTFYSAIHLHEHPSGTFTCHETSEKHKCN